MKRGYDRRTLRSRVCEIIGVDEETRRYACEIEHPRYAALWEEADDPSYLLPEYDSDWYAFALVECFCDYTAANVRRFASWWDDRDGVVLDLGAGIGASTVLFEELTRADAVFHAYGDGTQLVVATDLVEASTIAVGPNEKSIMNEIRPSAVMAFELFEHVRDPLALLRDITESGVEILCCANAFRAKDFGHWKTYATDGGEVSREQIGRLFGRELRLLGWRREETGFWNGRPSIFVRDRSTSRLF